MSNKRDDAVAAVPSQELSNDAKDGTLGFLLVGVVRGKCVGLVPSCNIRVTSLRSWYSIHGTSGQVHR